MKTKQPRQAQPTQLSPEATAISELQKAQELWRLLGDPRIRVQVPTENDAAQPSPALASQRYVTR
jgi:hypothetical protein